MGVGRSLCSLGQRIVPRLRISLPVPWYSTFWLFYTVYNALNNPALGFLSDRTRSRWGRRIPYVLFGGLPYAVAFALIFAAPFDGKEDPVALLIYFGMMIIIWEGLYTALATGYYGLLPEMFGAYQERTDVAAKMNIFQTGGLVIGVALPPILLLAWLCTLRVRDFRSFFASSSAKTMRATRATNDS